MALKFNTKTGGCSQDTCLDVLGCPDGRTPDTIIRRHDTRPPFRVEVEDCDGSMDLRGLVIEANMWAVAKLKIAITSTDTYFSLADNVGFDQIMVGDIIVMDRVRNPERMLVTGFDETNKFVQVQRGYHGTQTSAWKKGNGLKIFRILNGVAQSEILFDDVRQVDGTTEQDVVVGSYLVYEWGPEDTCLPGCYYFEFKVLKMIETAWFLPGGYWTGEVHQDADGYFHSGTILSDSSVLLSYDQVNNQYNIPITVWSGETHLHTDGNTYTGSSHNDGSILLSKTGVLSDGTGTYNGISAQAISVVPSFTEEGLTAEDFGCVLGEGVEWVRRFPLCNEGFLVKIVDSPTVEIT